MLAKVRNWEAEVVEEEAVKAKPAWHASRKDLHTDERVQPS